jgi:hypothetical protein
MCGDPQRGITYRLVLRGELSDGFAVLFEPVRLERISGTTVLTGAVIDQARLHGLLDQVHELGLELVSFEVVGESRNGRAEGAATGEGSRASA